ncbi:hypothetical protein QBC43DRAFT_351245 [Cladorrhinum sp. PSN259]|nr:hypothetical protein QBC43DRAFT_351245 [Cladorrhinum sp. PSN259]
MTRNLAIILISFFALYVGAQGSIASSPFTISQAHSSPAKPRSYPGARCKIGPNDSAWPKPEEWDNLNKTLDGRLLKPTPAPAVCYPSNAGYNPASCAFLTSGAAKATRFWLDDPLSVLALWTQGNTCLPVTSNNSSQEGRTCTQGGFPVYVVNATEPKHVQTAVNFARRKNIRLNIKNTGHDFLGRSNGYGSLSVWTHHMKGIQYFPDYAVSSYRGPVVKLEAGVETWEANNAMIARNFTFVVPKLPIETVGVAGGWFQGGGHSNLASLYGLGADNVLKLELVTAEGKFYTATEEDHPEYFYALRGGGGSTFAVVTAVYFKAYPGVITLGTAQFSLTTGPIPPSSTLATPTAKISSVEDFWTAVNHYLSFTKSIVDATGFGHGDISPLGNNSFSFAGQFLMPGMSSAETTAFISPLFDSIRKLGGVNITTPVPTVVPYAQPGNGTNTAPSTNTFSSRLIPRSNWDNATILSQTTSAIRKVVESGYSVRTRAYAPTLKAAGGEQGAAKAVNPAMRKMVLHTTVFSPVADLSLLSPEELKNALRDLNSKVEMLRTVTPGSGAYFNEAGRTEPNWQESFFGRENYEALLKIKKEVDPDGVFWAPLAVGSEGWRVESVDGLPTGNGPLCRVEG